MGKTNWCPVCYGTGKVGTGKWTIAGPIERDCHICFGRGRYDAPDEQEEAETVVSKEKKTNPSPKEKVIV